MIRSADDIPAAGVGPSPRNTLSRSSARRRRAGHAADVGGFGNPVKPRFRGEGPYPSLAPGIANF
jgi:hypothetical protein